jgi:mono/diheme cytochrome c family protein
MRDRKAIALLVGVALALAVGLPALAEGDEGKTLYASKCAMCHGADGVAKKMAEGSANLNDAEWQKANSAEAIEKVITEGKGKMTKYEGKLTAEQIKAVAAYVKSLK